MEAGTELFLAWRYFKPKRSAVSVITLISIVGVILGGSSFLLVGLYVWILKGYAPVTAFTISGCVGTALCVALIIASLVGTLIPMFFNKIHVDPAVASGPLITTTNDLIAAVTYYGLAWVLLINTLHVGA